MLFDLGAELAFQVTTEPMLFSLDIAFFSSSLVVTGVVKDVPPGKLVASAHPSRFFLEVNAGELEAVQSGDRAMLEFLPLEGTPAGLEAVSETAYLTVQ